MLYVAHYSNLDQVARSLTIDVSRTLSRRPTGFGRTWARGVGGKHGEPMLRASKGGGSVAGGNSYLPAEEEVESIHRGK